MRVSLTVNGTAHAVAANPADRLSNVLREDLGLTATKVGCDAGDCGACTVLMDGAPICACLTPIAQADGTVIETAEGLTEDGTLSLLQKSFLHHGAAQCGICTPGMLMSAKALLDQTPRPTRQQVEDALGGVLCRCTGYAKIIDAVMNAHRSNAAPAAPEVGAQIGAGIRHLDGRGKVTGDLLYGADKNLAEALEVRVVRSPHHAAAFEIGDTDAFLSTHSGLEAVLTAADIPGKNCFGAIPPYVDQPVFADGYARHRGDAIAALVGPREVVRAVDPDTFPVTWTPLAHSLIPKDAQAEGALPVHDTRPDNILIEGFVTRGTPREALQKAAHRVSLRTTTPFIEHAYIEPEAGHAIRVGDRIEVFGCTQAPHMDREGLADIMGLPHDAIRIRPSACGGGFGSKLDLSFQPFIALAAWVTGKPCRIAYTRSESMRATTKRHPSDIALTVGCDAEGKISGFDFQGTFNTGAYASWGPTVANRVPVHASGPYFVPDYAARGTAVHTHTPAAGAFRGFGVPPSAIAQELAFDLLADLAGIDRLEFRRRNALQNGQPTVCGQVFESGVGIADCLETLQSPWKRATREAADWNASNPYSALRKGVGVASCWYGCGNTSLPNPSTIRIGVRPDGQVVLHQGAMDIGQGANTVIAQIAADSLGVPVHALKLVDPDTDLRVPANLCHRQSG